MWLYYKSKLSMTLLLCLAMRYFLTYYEPARRPSSDNGATFLDFVVFRTMI